MSSQIGRKRRAEFVEEKQIVSVSRDDTQPADDLMGAVEDEVKPFARLIGVRNGVFNIDLFNKHFTCGRGAVDIPVNYSFSALTQDQGLYKYISKSQFSIVRNFEKEETIMIDNSRNGTLVNHEVLGKGKSRQLKNGDLISIGIPKLIVFVYEDCHSLMYPDELTKKYYITSHSLGKGGYGNVLLGYKKNDKTVVAIKLVNTQFSTRCSRAIAKSRDIKNEVDVMKKLNHPNIVRIYDHINFEKNSYIVIEYVGGGEFFSRIVDPQYNRMGLGEQLGKYYAYQLISALKYLHGMGICHRDIKPENILCSQKTERCILKLTDFGMAKSFERMKTKCGTPSYNAPEIVANEGLEYTPKVDVWSLGCVLFIVFSGYPPFSEEYEDMTMDEQVLKGRLIFHAQWRRITNETQKVIRSMLTVNPTARISAEELLASRWMQCADSRRAKHDILIHAHENQVENQSKKKKLM